MIVIPTPTNDSYTNTYQWLLYRHLPMMVIPTPTNDGNTDTNDCYTDTYQWW